MNNPCNDDFEIKIMILG